VRVKTVPKKLKALLSVWPLHSTKDLDSCDEWAGLQELTISAKVIKVARHQLLEFTQVCHFIDHAQHYSADCCYFYRTQQADDNGPPNPINDNMVHAPHMLMCVHCKKHVHADYAIFCYKCGTIQHMDCNNHRVLPWQLHEGEEAVLRSNPTETITCTICGTHVQPLPPSQLKYVRPCQINISIDLGSNLTRVLISIDKGEKILTWIDQQICSAAWVVKHNKRIGVGSNKNAGTADGCILIDPIKELLLMGSEAFPDLYELGLQAKDVFIAFFRYVLKTSCQQMGPAIKEASQPPTLINWTVSIALPAGLTLVQKSMIVSALFKAATTFESDRGVKSGLASYAPFQPGQLRIVQLSEPEAASLANDYRSLFKPGTTHVSVIDLGATTQCVHTSSTDLEKPAIPAATLMSGTIEIVRRLCSYLSPERRNVLGSALQDAVVNAIPSIGEEELRKVFISKLQEHPSCTLDEQAKLVDIFVKLLDIHCVGLVKFLADYVFQVLKGDILTTEFILLGGGTIDKRVVQAVQASVEQASLLYGHEGPKLKIVAESYSVMRSLELVGLDKYAQQRDTATSVASFSVLLKTDNTNNTKDEATSYIILSTKGDPICGAILPRNQPRPGETIRCTITWVQGMATTINLYATSDDITHTADLRSLRTVEQTLHNKWILASYAIEQPLLMNRGTADMFVQYRIDFHARTMQVDGLLGYIAESTNPKFNEYSNLKLTVVKTLLSNYTEFTYVMALDTENVKHVVEKLKWSDPPSIEI
jgi:hypothetical protein